MKHRDQNITFITDTCNTEKNVAFICKQVESTELNPKTQEVYLANHREYWSTPDLACADWPLGATHRNSMECLLTSKRKGREKTGLHIPSSLSQSQQLNKLLFRSWRDDYHTSKSPSICKYKSVLPGKLLIVTSNKSQEHHTPEHSWDAPNWSQKEFRILPGTDK